MHQSASLQFFSFLSSKFKTAGCFTTIRRAFGDWRNICRMYRECRKTSGCYHTAELLYQSLCHNALGHTCLHSSNRHGQVLQYTRSLSSACKCNSLSAATRFRLGIMYAAWGVIMALRTQGENNGHIDLIIRSVDWDFVLLFAYCRKLNKVYIVSEMYIWFGHYNSFGWHMGFIKRKLYWKKGLRCRRYSVGSDGDIFFVWIPL